jgi:hypothetical protein
MELQVMLPREAKQRLDRLARVHRQRPAPAVLLGPEPKGVLNVIWRVWLAVLQPPAGGSQTPEGVQLHSYEQIDEDSVGKSQQKPQRLEVYRGKTERWLHGAQFSFLRFFCVFYFIVLAGSAACGGVSDGRQCVVSGPLCVCPQLDPHAAERKLLTYLWVLFLLWICGKTLSSH